MGMIRYQWWREAIDEIYSGKPPRKHDVVLPLSDTIKKYDISREHLDRMINARERDIDEVPFETKSDLISYLEETASCLNLAISKILLRENGMENEGDKTNNENNSSSKVSSDISSVINNFSKAWGLNAIIRSSNGNLAKGRNIFPKDLCEKYNLDYQKYGSPKFPEDLKPLVEELVLEGFDLVERGRANLFQIKKQNNSQIKQLSSILIYGKLAEFRLSQIRKNKYDVLRGKIDRYIPIFKMLSLLLSVKFQKF